MASRLSHWRTLNATVNLPDRADSIASIRTGMRNLFMCMVGCKRGMTIIELIIGIAIASLISGSALIAVHQILTASAQANDMQLAVSQVRAAEHWMTRDTLTAQDIALGINAGFPVTLSWTDIDGGNHSVEYSLEPMPSGALKNLRRDYYGTAGTLDSSLVVASHIDSSQSSCTLPGPGAVEVTLAATSRSYTATRTFQAMTRAS
jgi:prepilin-type N-terminal cleavage/methylation domain-containing protein